MQDQPILVIGSTGKTGCRITYIRGLADQARAEHPDALTRQLLLLKEEAIVTAHLQGPDGVAAQARAAASILLEKSLTP